MKVDKAKNRSKSEDGRRDEILRSFLERDYMDNPRPSALPHSKDNGDKINKNGWPYFDVKLRCLFLCLLKFETLIMAAEM